MSTFTAVVGFLTFLVVAKAGGGRLFEIGQADDNGTGGVALLQPEIKRIYGGFLNRLRQPSIFYHPYRRIDKKFVLSHMLDRREEKKGQTGAIPPSRLWWRGKRIPSGLGLSPVASFFMTPDKKLNRFLYSQQLKQANDDLEKRMSFGHLMTDNWNDLKDEKSERKRSIKR